MEKRPELTKLTGWHSLVYAGKLVRDWGFPRELDEDHDFRRATWWSFGRATVFFWIASSGDTPGVGYLHICTHPLWPGARYARRLIRTIYNCAREQGFTQLAAADCSHSGYVARYLRRLGWRDWPDEGPGWMIFDLADGGSDGQEQGPEEAEPRAAEPREGQARQDPSG